MCWFFSDAKGEKSSLDSIPFLSFSACTRFFSLTRTKSIGALCTGNVIRDENEEKKGERRKIISSQIRKSRQKKIDRSMLRVFSLFFWRFFIMRRHSLDPESIRKQLISMFTPSRKRQSNSNNHLTVNFGRRMRRFSVPEKNSQDLQPIDEVSWSRCLSVILLRFSFAFIDQD